MRPRAYRFAELIGDIVDSTNVRDCKSECSDIFVASLALYIPCVDFARGLQTYGDFARRSAIILCSSRVTLNEQRRLCRRIACASFSRTLILLRSNFVGRSIVESQDAFAIASETMKSGYFT